MGPFTRISTLVLIGALTLSGCAKSPRAVAVIDGTDITFAQVDEAVEHYTDNDPLFNRLLEDGSITKAGGEANLKQVTPNVLISLTSLKQISDKLGLKPLRADEVEAQYRKEVESIGGEKQYIDRVAEAVKTQPTGNEPLSITLIKESLVQIPMLEQRIGEKLNTSPEALEHFMQANGVNEPFDKLDPQLQQQVMTAFNRSLIQAEQAKMGVHINPIMAAQGGVNIFGNTSAGQPGQ